MIKLALLLVKPIPSPHASGLPVVDPGAGEGMGKIGIALVIVLVAALVIGAVASGKGPSKR